MALTVVRFLRELHWLAKTRREERTLQALVAVWLALMALNCYGLYYAYTQLLPVSSKDADHSIASIVWWGLVNLSWLTNIFVYYDYGQPNAAGQPQLVEVARQVSLAAIYISCATLLVWPLIVALPDIPLTLPSYVTLVVGNLCIFALGVFYLDAMRRAKLAQKSSDGVI